jgi:malate synthase
MASASVTVSGLTLTAGIPEGSESILSPQALAFVASLAEQFGARRSALLEARTARQLEFDAGTLPDFNPDTKPIRISDWKVAEIPADLRDRRVEITGPAEPKMMINALNSGAKVFMADLEDSLSPTWAKVVEAQKALYDAVRHQLTYTSDEGKEYRLNEKDLAVLIVRPRGWHLDEKHVLLNGVPIAGALLDFGLYFYHNANERVRRGTGAYFYLPKLENHHEAQLWADIFAFSEKALGMKPRTIRATVLIEVLTATFEMHEILHALKDYCVALNCGRWDYIFSAIKKLHSRKDFILPERVQVTMTTHFLKSYAELLIKTCHKRGALAMGGMAAFIPVKNDEAANEKAFAAVKADKEREATYGHDGTWVAHPALIPVAKEVFDRLMPTPNQVDKLREDVSVSAKDLLTVPPGTITENGVRNNISVSIQYTASWLRGNGCVPLFNLMEDAATAEIARSQLWQWVHHNATLDDGRRIDLMMVREFAKEEVAKLHVTTLEAASVIKATEIVLKLVEDSNFTEFLTLPAYAALKQ